MLSIPLFLNGLSCAFQTVFAGRCKPAFSFFESDLRSSRRFVQSAIWFQRFGPMFAPPRFRTERSRPDRSGPGSLRLGFLGHVSFTMRAAFDQRTRSPALRPSRLRRDQKTFGAGPRSFKNQDGSSRISAHYSILFASRSRFATEPPAPMFNRWAMTIGSDAAFFRPSIQHIAVCKVCEDCICNPIMRWYVFDVGSQRADL
jgi:hypothetical protein